jgi:hypothetical protein
LLPAGATLTLSTRSGNVADAAAAGWSPWTDAAPAAEFMPVASPPARFLQYRLTFGSDAMTAATPVVRDVEVAYQVPNLPPAVSSVRVTAGDPGDPDARAKRTIAWESADPNDDALRYAVQIRPTAFAAAGGEGAWITLKDKLEGQTHEWDTRTVADGRYEVRVTASDEHANAAGSGRTASRVSDPFVVDNTPPAIGDVVVARGDGGAVAIDCVVVDRGNTVEKLEYAVNGLDGWRLALPSDMMADSPREVYRFAIRGPMDGPIALRATDSAGNQGYATVAAPPGVAKRPADGRD